LKRLLLVYQLLTGASDTATGLLLIFVPALTLRLMKLHMVPAALPLLSYIGVFVLSVGMACFYGALLALKPVFAVQLRTVWLLTAITRGLVAVFVVSQIASGKLEAGWITVALTDGVFAVLQSVGLLRGWLRDA